MSPNYPPLEESRRLSLCLLWGEEERAKKLLDALNMFQTAFGFPPYDMPEPAVPKPDLVIADASKVSPAEFLGLPSVPYTRVCFDRDPKTRRERFAA